MKSQSETSESNLGASQAPEPKKTRTRKIAVKSGLVAELQAQLREARKIDKAVALIMTFSQFGILKIKDAVLARANSLGTE